MSPRTVSCIVYRDGWRVYAWHGLAVPEDWILYPEAIPPAKLRGLGPSLRRFAESRRGKAPARRDRPSTLFAAKLPNDAIERLHALRTHAAGKLPLYDRYVAGQHTAVWSELMAQRAAVRSEPLAADALAVAYETMSRVEQNIRALVLRLGEIGYKFTTSEGARRRVKDVHVPPDGRTPTVFNGSRKRAARCRYRYARSTKWWQRRPHRPPSKPRPSVCDSRSRSDCRDRRRGGVVGP
jgi:hypothetical protein